MENRKCRGWERLGSAMSHWFRWSALSKPFTRTTRAYVRQRWHCLVCVTMESRVKIDTLWSSRMRNVLFGSLKSSHSDGSSGPMLLAPHPSSYPWALQGIIRHESPIPPAGSEGHQHLHCRLLWPPTPPWQVAQEQGAGAGLRSVFAEKRWVSF